MSAAAFFSILQKAQLIKLIMTAENRLMGRRLKVTGVVQGVGFRPFIYRLARQRQLSGWVCNTPAGVEIELEGAPSALDAFMQELQTAPPALARIDSIDAADFPPQGRQGFTIRASASGDAVQANMPADVAMCGACNAELYDPGDRRHLYPFINCTDCGPRFTIIRQAPYDRPHTTMAAFAMCDACRREYENPGDRRFHAEPIACPACGPKIWLEQGGQRRAGDALAQAAALLRAGAIVAIKGLGGFHLAADARQDAAVAELRRRKGRAAKPFALMVRDVTEAERLCHLTGQTRRLLNAPERPIVLAEIRGDCPISPQAAPGLKVLGLMLPYTPLHRLLLDAAPPALVMTSGNLSEEPLAFGNDEARTRLAGLADAFLMHDRDIQAPCDDSVVRPAGGDLVIPLRRARGYVPLPVPLDWQGQALLGVGAEQKNTFCMAAHGQAVLSQHIGDLDTVETFDYYHKAMGHFADLCRLSPQVAAHDLHPGYLSSRYAKELPGVRLIGVQHHHAHIAACLAEHRRTDRVIGLALDGAGFGPDGTVWGGEILLADLADYARAGCLAPVRLPGGEAAIRDPRRMAAAYLWAAFGHDAEAMAARLELTFTPLEWRILRHQLSGDGQAPITTSAGRLFDAVAAALGICRVRTYEGQPAAELEMHAAAGNDEDWGNCFWSKGLAGGTGWKPVPLGPDLLTLDTLGLFRQAVQMRLDGADTAVIAARFHGGLAELLAQACLLLRERTGLYTAALSGGVFQNARLLLALHRRLTQAGFEVLAHRLTPPNDGGISLGQVAVAAARLQASGPRHLDLASGIGNYGSESNA
jgi:hydrogenase maturation protein HypF